jgi:predicted ester cyclase
MLTALTMAAEEIRLKERRSFDAFNEAEGNKRRMRRFFSALNKGRLDEMFENMAPDVVDHSAHSRAPGGVEGAREWFTMLHNGFPDLRATFWDMVADGDKVVAHVIFTGTHSGEFWGVAATGKQVTVNSTDTVRFANGKYVEHWGNLDALGLLQQVGAVPAPSQTRPWLDAGPGIGGKSSE